MQVVKAVILKSSNYSETQKIIHAFSRESGFISFISPAFLFKKRNNAVNIMQIVEIEFFQNEKSQLHKIKTLSPIVNTSGIYFDIYKMNVVLLWGEILNLLLKNEGKNENLFDFITQSVEYLNTTPGGIGNFNLFFLYRLTGLIGFRINTDSYAEDYLFSIESGNFQAASPQTTFISGPYAAKAIHRLLTGRLEELQDIQLNRDSRKILLDILLIFLSTHLSIDFNIKSIQVIRDVFS